MSTATPDVVVIGAGPAGCTTALAHARLGHRVLLLEAERKPPARLAGEWLHPQGVEVLRRLDVHVPTARPAQGFVLHPEDGGPPITLACPRGGRATTAHHRDLVTHLRDTAAGHPAITLVLGARATAVDHATVTYTQNGGPERSVPVERVVGSDGQASLVRRALRLAPAPALTVSRTAGLLLRGADLPTEGYGHVFAGGPGPALAYRVDDDTVRLTIDVPLRSPRSAQLLSYLKHAYLPVLPARLAAALRRALEDRAVQWAANRVRTRTFHGRGPYALIGDAAGTCHPLTASGLTIALRDAECLAGTHDVTGHGRRRQAAVRAHEHLAAAMHRLLSDSGHPTAALRASMYAILRTSAFERERMMRVLCAEEHRTLALGGAVLHVAAHALRGHLGGGPTRPPWRSTARTCGEYLDWLRWMSRVRHIPAHPPETADR
ncbi:FAD-dependent oxidoreductase [Streptomyces sp. Je 1-369]|uniref:FAD-dependent oxidoreductase n=1 Tax=Streptomyces sp. Je 1-369 TaxID=2966192 RepID=UPI002285D8DE|nr:NAD(P)/FAD-dependent oxidoreductase [Streptomyces sp. Je 1-369]WAL97964.1 FAD-dependent monooxygenase [Streptomyces sp. Je 1-369]